MKAIRTTALPWLLLLAILASVASALPIDDESVSATGKKPLPFCADVYDEPCQCPSNTVFQNDTATVTIGANAKDVHAIMYSFFNVSWIGTVPLSTSGKDLTVGATRTMPLGDLQFVEKIVRIWSKPNGSFLLQHGQADSPLFFTNATGSYYFSGYWDKLRVDYISPTATSIVWHTWGCMTTPGGFGIFHVNAINAALNILKSQNQLIAPTSEITDVYYPPEWRYVDCC